MCVKQEPQHTKDTAANSSSLALVRENKAAAPLTIVQPLLRDAFAHLPSSVNASFISMDNFPHGPKTAKIPQLIHVKPLHLTTQMDLPLSIVIAINARLNAILVHFHIQDPIINRSLRVPLYSLWRINPSRCLKFSTRIKSSRLPFCPD